MTIYRGFSTKNKHKNFKLTDYELIKQDLINQFNTRRGERVMNPDFGTDIWDLLFDPFTDELKNSIQDDIIRIAQSDPRIAIEQAIVTEYQHGIQIELELRVVDTNQLDTMVLTFDQRLAPTV
jgi:phage baseplate assembly protein W